MKPSKVYSFGSVIASTVTAVALSGISMNAQAGTQLKLMKGTFRTAEIVNTMSVSRVNDYVIQFKNSVKEADKSALRAMGVTVFRYLPDDALIVRADLATLNKYAEQTGKVNGIVSFQANWKLADNLPVVSVFSRDQQLPILLTLFQASERSRVEEHIKAVAPSAKILVSDDRYITVATDAVTATRIAAIAGIEFVEKVEQIVPLSIQLDAPVEADRVAAGDYSDLTGYETGTKVLGMDAAWAQGFIGEGQTVAMADTGLDAGDTGRIASDFQGGVRSGYFYGAGAKDWSDPMGHGTHVAGSVMGRGTASGGKIRGAGYGAMIVAQAMWSPIIDNLNVPPQMAKMFDPAYNDGARVHTNSWGAAANFGVYESMAQQVDQFMWDHPDFLLMFAAGNSGTDKNADGKIGPNSIGTPATAKNCVSVGASENLESKGGIQKKISELRPAKDNWSAEPIASSKVSDNPNGVAMFSSRGPTKDNRIKPDIVSPGTNILSTRSHIPDSSPLWGAYNEHYAWSGGTSMATPLAAGFAAVTREVLIKRHKIANPSAAMVKATLMHTAFDMYPGQYGEGTATQELAHRPNNDEGYGRLDMNKLISLNGSSHFFDQTAGVAEGETFEQSVTVGQGQTLVANLVYTDAPGTPSAGATLVNNLDLIVQGPGGEMASHDTINNAEIVEKKGLAAGTYKVQVRGVKVPMGKSGKQPFALVISVL